MINKIKLFVKDTKQAKKTEELVKKELVNSKYQEVNESYDLAISIGGDGTFIKMIHSNNFNSNIYYAAINAGSLGFLTTVDHSEFTKLFNSLDNNSYKVREMNLLKVEVVTEKETKEYFCINELTIRKNNYSTMKGDLYIDNVLFEQFAGDGVVVSTPVGSSAYSLTLGGSLVDNNLNAFEVTPLAPLNSKIFKPFNNSIVLNSNRKMTFVPNGNNDLCILTDGKIINLNNVKRVTCTLPNKTIKTIVLDDYNYIKQIHTKLVD